MAISVDVVISGKTTTSVEGTASSAVVTTNLQEDKLGTKGGIISGSIIPNQNDAIDLGSPSKRFLNLYAKTAHLAADSLKLGDEATISAGPGGGFSFDTDGETIFGDIKVRNLTVTGTQSVISSTDLAVKDNIIIINSGEAGAGITLTSGGLVVDRGTLENATILFNDDTDRFELNFPISVDGSELAIVPNLITTGQTLQGQILTNDTDIANLTTNLASTGNLLTTNLNSTGTTLAANLNSTGTTVATNLVTSGQYLTSEVSTLSGLSVFHSMTGNFATHIKDLDDVTLAGNQGKYLKVNSAGDGIAYDIPPVTGVGGEGGGAVKFTGLVDAPNDYSSLQTEFPANGGLVAVNSASESLVYLNSGVFATDHDLITTGNTLNSQRDALSGDLISTGNALDAARDTLSGNLISTGNNLQSQITSNDSDIASINTNLVSTGNKLDSLRDILSGNLISSGNNLESQIINNDADISTLSGNLITTGTTLTNTIISTGNHLDSLRDTLSGNLISSGNTLNDERDTLSGNLITTGQNLQNDIDTLSGNLISTGNNLQSQITNNDTDISALQLATGEIQNVKFNKAGGTISGEILPNASGTINLGSPSLPFRSGHFDDLIVSSDSIKIGSEATLSSPPEGGIKFDTTGTIAFGDVSIKNLTVTGTRTIVETTDTAIKDNIILLNSGEDGAGITLSSGGLVIDRGSATDANILFNDSTDQFEVNFPLAVEGSLAVKQNQTGIFAEAANLVTTGQTLQTQIISNDGDISTLTSNLASTGNTLTSNVSTLTTNLASTGSTLAADIVTVSGLTQGNDTDLATITSNLATTGQTLTSEISTVSGLVTSNDSDISTLTSNLVTTGQTLQTQITSNDSDISTLTSNLGTTGQTLQTQIISNDSDISTLTSNLATTGQTLQTQITSNDTDISTLTSNITSTGDTLDTKIDTLSGVVTLDSETGNLVDTSMTGSFAVNFLDLDDTPGSLGAVGQSVVVNADRDGLIFSGVSAGGGGGSSTFVGLSDTPGALTASRLLAVNSAGNSVEFLESGTLVTDAETGVFATSANLVTTGQTLTTNTNTVSSNLVSTGSVVDDVSGNLITTGQTLQTQITSNDSDISTLTSNLVTTGQTLTTNINTVATNLGTSGQTLQTQITSNDSDISTLTNNLGTTGQTLQTQITSNDSDIASLTTNLVTTGQTLQTQIISNDSDITTLTSNLVSTGTIVDDISGNLTTTGQTLQTQILSNDSDISTLDSTTVKLTSNQTIAGNKTFNDTVTIGNLNVTGTQTTITATNLAIKDNLIEINSGESGAGITLASGGITINRGSATNANILFNDSTDRFELNFPLATDGSLVATAPNLITTGQTLQTQIISNDSDISTLTTNLGTTGQTIQTQIISNDSDISTLTTNLGATGQTLQTQIISNDSDISTLTSNLATTGQTLTNNINTVSTNLGTSGQTLQNQIISNDSDIATLTTNLGTTGQTLQTQIISNDGDISTLTTNLATTGQTLQTQITSNDGDITTLTSNLVTTGQTLQTQITSNDGDITTLTSNLITTGQTLTSEISTLSGLATLDSETGSLIDTSMTGDFADTTILESFTQGLNVGTSSNLASRKLHVVGDVEISGTIYQSGSVFEGGGGGGGSSTFVGLSDTPGSFTANKYLSVNSAGNAIEMVDTIQSGYQSVDQGYFTGLTLDEAAVGIVQNASGTISNLDLEDNKFDVSVIEERDFATGDSHFDSVVLQLSFDGADGATTSTDDSDVGNTVNFVNGAELDTAYKKFGTASAKFDGTNDSVSIPYMSETEFGNIDFTIEGWFRSQAAGNQILCAQGNGSNGFWILINPGSDTLSFRPYGTVVYDSQMTSQTINQDQWHHFAVSKSGTTSYLWIDGAGGTTATHNGGLENDSNTAFTIGGFYANNTWFNGHIDEFRFTTGVARYTSSFTPPAKAFDTVTEYSEAKYIGQIGGINDSDVDYGIQKLSNSELMIKKLSDDNANGGLTPDRLYVNVNKLGALGKGIAFNKLYTGDGTTTNFAIPSAVDNVRDVLVSVEGLVQIPTTDYTLAGTTGVSFTTGVTSGHLVDIRHLALGPSGAAGSDADASSVSANLITTGQTLTTSINTVSTNLISTGSVVDDISGNLITTGQTLQTQITSNDSEISTLTSNLVSTGSFVDDVSGNLITTGQTLQTQITSNDGDITTLTSNLVTTGQTLQTQITSNDSDISTLTSNLGTTGQTLTSEISTLSGLATLDSETGSLIDTSMTGDFADTTILESFTQGLNIGTSNNLASRKLHVVGDIEISGTIYQSGSVFEGGGGGGGGSSTFVGLSDTPGSLTANRVLTVNAAGNAVETTYNTSVLSGHQSVEQGYFTGLTLGGTGTGILQNASGTISNLDLADNKFDVSVIEERDSAVGDSNFDKVELLLPFNGANDATSTTDESDSNHTVSFNGSSDISTAQSKFGGSSLYLPGGNNDHVTIAGSADFNFGTGDFTIEMWVYRTHTAYGYIFETRGGEDTTSTDGISLYLGSGGNDELRVAVNRSNVIDINQDHQTNDQWQHFAVVREGSTLTLYIDGTARGSGSNSTDFNRNRPFRLGNIHNASLDGGYGFQGYIDDFRVTKGLARYTSNFTPTSAAHPTSAGITENKYIGQIGGIDDSDVDYGIEKLSNSQLMIKKLSDNTFTPDRLYVNVNKLGALGHGIAFDQVYTGDGTTTNYLLSENVSNARDVLVSVEGLIQTPIIDYTLAGTTGVSFTTGVVSGHEISFRHLALGPSGADGASADISYLTERFTGNGVVSGFEMSRSISTADEIFVFVNGLVQDSGANFSVTAGTGLYFTSGEIVSGDKIMVRHIY